MLLAFRKWLLDQAITVIFAYFAAHRRASISLRSHQRFLQNLDKSSQGEYFDEKVRKCLPGGSQPQMSIFPREYQKNPRPQGALGKGFA